MYCRHSSQVHGDICEDWLQYWSVVMSILWCARCYGAARSAETLFMMIAEDFVTASKQKLSSKSGMYYRYGLGCTHEQIPSVTGLYKHLRCCEAVYQRVSLLQIAAQQGQAHLCASSSLLPQENTPVPPVDARSVATTAGTGAYSILLLDF